MNSLQYNKYNQLIKKFEKYVSACKNSGMDAVFNKDLKNINLSDNIKYILVADNPGKNEKIKNQYLIGQSGTIARNFFNNNNLVNEFEHEVIVLNKTYLHTNATGDLKKLMKNEDSKKHLIKSQEQMALIVLELHKLLDCSLWIVGCSELKKNGIFSTFWQSINVYYEMNDKELYKKLFCYKHFSFGQFHRDINESSFKSISAKLKSIGTKIKKDIF